MLSIPRFIPSLFSICDVNFFRQDIDLDPTHPDFYNAFAKINEGTRQQLIAFIWLSKKTAIEVATLPLFNEACDEYPKLVFNALKTVIDSGSAEDRKKACIPLLRASQNSELFDSTRNLAHVFLLQLLNKELDPGVAKDCVDSHDICQAISNRLMKYLDNTLEEIAILKGANPAVDGEKTALKEAVIRAIYNYLKLSSDHTDDRLLDDAIEAYSNKKAESAKARFQMLIECADDEAIKAEAQLLLNIIHSCEKTFYEHVINVRNNKRPKTAYVLGKIHLTNVTTLVMYFSCENPYDFNCRAPSVHSDFIPISKDRQSDWMAAIYFENSAIQGHVPAIEALNLLSEISLCEKTLSMLTNIAERGQIDGFSGKELALFLKERIFQVKANQISDQARSELLFVAQEPISKKFRRELELCHKLDFIKSQPRTKKDHLANRTERIFETAKEFFENDILKFIGKDILTLLFELDHQPLAIEAREYLDNWLDNTKNLIGLIRTAGIKGCNLQPRGTPITLGNSDYCQNIAEINVDYALKKIEHFKEQGETQPAQQLINQLIDVAIYLEMQALYYSKTFCSRFYKRLIGSTAIDEAYKAELQMRIENCGEMQKATEETRQRLLFCADIKGRPYAAYQIAKIHFTMPPYYDKLDQTSAVDIQISKEYFKIAIEQGGDLVSAECGLALEQISDGVDRVVAEADKELKLYKHKQRNDRTHFDKAQTAYQWASIAGHQEAYLKFLDLPALQ